MNQEHRELFHSNEKYTQKFQFIRDDVFLIASIDAETKKQHLIFQKINLTTKVVEFSDEMQCIQTAIAKISPEKYIQLMEDSDAKQNFINEALKKKTTDSVQFSKQMPKQLHTEDLTTNIDLNVDEKFFAFRSWVQGIAEAGMDALYLQNDLDDIARGSLPIVEFLCRNLIRIDSSFIPQYLSKIERECRFEGVYHKTSLRANLGILLEGISNFDLFDENKCATARYEELWFTPLNESSRELIKEYLLMMVEIDPKYLFNSPDPRIRKFIAEGSNFTQFPEYKKLITDEHPQVRLAVAENPSAVKFPEYRLLLSDEYGRVRGAAEDNLGKYRDFSV
jgi:hypothetical protein